MTIYIKNMFFIVEEDKTGGVNYDILMLRNYYVHSLPLPFYRNLNYTNIFFRSVKIVNI